MTDNEGSMLGDGGQGDRTLYGEMCDDGTLIRLITYTLLEDKDYYEEV